MIIDNLAEVVALGRQGITSELSSSDNNNYEEFILTKILRIILSFGYQL